MREYFEQQLPPGIDGITVVFFEELADGTLVKNDAIHPDYTNLSGMAFVRLDESTGMQCPVFRRVA
jgi:hypothetical protein